MGNIFFGMAGIAAASASLFLKRKVYLFVANIVIITFSRIEREFSVGTWERDRGVRASFLPNLATVCSYLFVVFVVFCRNLKMQNGGTRAPLFSNLDLVQVTWRRRMVLRSAAFNQRFRLHVSISPPRCVALSLVKMFGELQIPALITQESDWTTKQFPLLASRRHASTRNKSQN